MARADAFLHGARVIAAFGLGGAVFFGLGLGWVPALAAIDMHVVGAIAGSVAGAVANAKHYI